jgi:hypothetical protein
METARNLMATMSAAKPPRPAAAPKKRKPKVRAGAWSCGLPAGPRPQLVVYGRARGQAATRAAAAPSPSPPLRAPPLTRSPPPRRPARAPPPQGIRPRPDHARRSGRLTGKAPEYGEIKGDFDEAVTYSDYEGGLEDLLAGRRGFAWGAGVGLSSASGKKAEGRPRRWH